MNRKTGIDKIQVTTPDFRVKQVNSAIFGIDASTPQGGNEGEVPYLLTDSTKREVRARKIYHNSPQFIGNYTITNKGLLVQFNPSKLVHPYLLTEVGTPDYKKAIDRVQTEMQSIGIDADFGGMKLVRVDIAKQAEMTLPCNQYEAAFKLMKGKRTKERAYEGGYLFSNKSNQCMFYDKAEEMRVQKQDAMLQGENNFMRAEVRMLKSKPVASILKVATLDGLNTLHAEQITEAYNQFIQNRIFSKVREGQQMTFEFFSEVQILKHYKETNVRFGWQKYIMDNGLDVLLLKIGSIEIFGKLCAEAGYSRTQVFNIREQLKQMINMKAQMDRVRNEVTPATLIAELQEQFAA